MPSTALKLKPRHSRQLHVGDQARRLIQAAGLQRILGGRKCLDGEAERLEEPLDGVTNGFVIVDACDKWILRHSSFPEPTSEISPALRSLNGPGVAATWLKVGERPRPWSKRKRLRRPDEISATGRSAVSRLRNPGQFRRRERSRQNPLLKGGKIGRRSAVEFGRRLTRRSPLAVVGKCLKLVRNRSVGHISGGAEQGPCCFKIFLAPL